MHIEAVISVELLVKVNSFTMNIFCSISQMGWMDFQVDDMLLSGKLWKFWTLCIDEWLAIKVQSVSFILKACTWFYLFFHAEFTTSEKNIYSFDLIIFCVFTMIRITFTIFSERKLSVNLQRTKKIFFVLVTFIYLFILSPSLFTMLNRAVAASHSMPHIKHS